LDVIIPVVMFDVIIFDVIIPAAMLEVEAEDDI
jgi:hypothetical protein